MDMMSTPATLYVAAGAILAAVITGFFSFVNLVSSKENKISEFRLAWVDGLRNEISEYSAAVQELTRLKILRDSHKEAGITEAEAFKEWINNSRDGFQQAIKTMSCIQMRLNPDKVANDPESHEAVLMRLLNKAKDDFNQGKYSDAQMISVQIREAASPLLKSTWESIKKGEKEYQSIRQIAWNSIRVGVASSALTFITLFVISFR